MQPGRVVLVSGPSGVGKSSVARRLAQASPDERAVHLHTDDFYAAIVKGFVAPQRPEAHEQNVVVVAAFAASARRFAQGGFEVVVDGVVGPWALEPWRGLVREGIEAHYVVLRPDQATTLARGTARAAPDALTDARVIAEIWQAFADLGPFESHVLDSTALALDDTVARVRALVAQGNKRLVG